MDPITLLITLAPMLISYAQEKKQQSSYSLEGFQDWLRANHHNELMDEIKNNQGLLAEIEIILEKNHSDTLNQLKKLENQLSSVIANNVVGSKLAKGISSVELLSEQALNFIKQMNAGNSTRILQMHQMGKVYFFAIDGSIGALVPEEEGFILEDLELASKLGYLISDFNPKGEKMYRMTRLGSKI